MIAPRPVLQMDDRHPSREDVEMAGGTGPRIGSEYMAMTGEVTHIDIDEP